MFLESVSVLYILVLYLSVASGGARACRSDGYLPRRVVWLFT